MNIYENELYRADVQRISELPYEWEKLTHMTVAVSGATGMVGSFLADVLMERNHRHNQDVTLILMGRSRNKLVHRFREYMDDANVELCVQDVNDPITEEPEPDYVIHAASTTHPRAYAEEPIGTITANVIGTKNLLDWAVASDAKRFVFLSSVEIYGENRGTVNAFSETDLGYIDCNTMRAGYPESKRTGEALCQAYRREKGLDSVVVRLSRTYGPTMLASDTKAISQMIGKGLKGEDIVLKSAGTQLYSYSYVADAVSAILFCMLQGEDGEAYNVVSDESDIRLADLAQTIADWAGTNVVFEMPDATEAAGYSKATRATMSTDKLKALGWKSLYPLAKALPRTLSILAETSEE